MGFRIFSTWLYNEKAGSPSPQGELYPPFYPHAAVYPFIVPTSLPMRDEA
jgi:hypothetical protein